jgi:glycerol uptake facilitator-like aquaporin
MEPAFLRDEEILGRNMVSFSAVEDAHEPLNKHYKKIVHQTSLWYPSGIARKHLCAELFGSIFLQFLRGCAVVNSMDATLNGSDYAAHHGQSGLLISALGTGFAYTALLYATAGGNGSGGKLNPAVSTSLFMSRRMDPRTYVAELMMQFIGAIIGGGLVWLVIPSQFMYYSGDAAVFHLEGAMTTLDIVRGMFTEFLLTSMLVIVYIATAEDFHNRVYTKTMWPLAVGAATAAGMLGGNNSGGAMNPASGVAAAIAYWDIRNLAAFLISTFSVRV